MLIKESELGDEQLGTANSFLSLISGTQAFLMDKAARLSVVGVGGKHEKSNAYVSMKCVSEKAELLAVP